MSKLDRLGWAVCDWYEVEGRRFGVRSTSAAFGAWVRSALGAYRVDGPEDPDDDPSYAAVVEDETSQSGRVGRGLNVLYLGTWDIVRTTDVRTLARSLLLEIERLAFSQREDAVYLEAAVIRGNGRTILVPQYLVPALSRAGRRVQRATGAMLPGTMAVAVQPETGRLGPVATRLDLPRDVLSLLPDPSGPPDARAWVDQEQAVDRVLLAGNEPSLLPVSRAETLAALAGSIRNLDVMGGRAIRAVARLVEGSEPFRVRFTGTGHMIEVLSVLMNGGHAAVPSAGADGTGTSP